MEYGDYCRYDEPMNLAEPVISSWQARLTLDFERRAGATVLSRREHFGPLRVQKALYPEGEAVCHAIVLHPPSGIAGGDQLEIAANVGPSAHALLTTPCAGKWYRSGGAWAGQRLDFTADQLDIPGDWSMPKYLDIPSSAAEAETELMPGQLEAMSCAFRSAMEHEDAV